MVIRSFPFNPTLGENACTHKALIFYRCTIITNPVQAESLHSRLIERHGNDLDVNSKLTIGKEIANALGYLHAKNIVHGRLCSKNVFLEHKVQLSLLDYCPDSTNIIYSSPLSIEVILYYNILDLLSKV